MVERHREGGLRPPGNLHDETQTGEMFFSVAGFRRASAWLSSLGRSALSGWPPHAGLLLYLGPSCVLSPNRVWNMLKTSSTRLTFLDHLNNREETDEDGSSEVLQQNQTSFKLFEEKKHQKSQTTPAKQTVKHSRSTPASSPRRHRGDTQTRLAGVSSATTWD